MVIKIKKIFAKNTVIQILQYFFILTVTIVLFYGIFYLIYFVRSKNLIEYVELRFKGTRPLSVVLRDMLGVECATVFPMLIPFIIVFGYMKSKRIYVPVISALLFTPFLPLIYQKSLFSYYNVATLIIYCVSIIFGIALAYILKLFLWAFKKIENKMHNIGIFLLRNLILLVMCFFIFYIIYFLFFVFYVTLTEGVYFYTPYSWDYPPTGPYYLFLLAIILPLFMGTNKKYLIYNAVIIILLSVLLYRNMEQFSFDIKKLYTPETFTLNSFIYNFVITWQFRDILLLLLTFFSSSSLFIIISKIKNIKK